MPFGFGKPQLITWENIVDHNVKVNAPYFIHIVEKRKLFEIRKNDRDYQVGDRLCYQVNHDDRYNVWEIYKERVGQIPMTYEIIYVHSGLGLAEGYVALSIRPWEAKFGGGAS